MSALDIHNELESQGFDPDSVVAVGGSKSYFVPGMSKDDLPNIDGWTAIDPPRHDEDQ